MKAISLLLLMSAIGTHCFAADLDKAARLGLERVQRAALNWQSNEDCFSCHHHTLPMLASLEGDRAGYGLDADWMKSQADTTHAYFEPFEDEMNAGAHVPGGAATVGYGLWALRMDGRPSDTTTTAMVNYLLQIQGVARLRGREPSKLLTLNSGRWIASCRRAPMQASMVGDTVLALVGIEHYASQEQSPRVSMARDAAEKWLGSLSLTSQQDQIWRLWGLHHLGATGDTKRLVLDSILAAQRADGGWAETESLSSDAFSTGQTIYMLRVAGISPTDAAITRGCDYLVRTQHADGSWLFESHVKPVQPFFDNGDPHGKNQFISVAATAWATAALFKAIPPSLQSPKGYIPANAAADAY